MLIDFKQFSEEQVYSLMVQTIVPRPIAWVLSDNGSATYNVAPFSFFAGVASAPPLLMISVGWKNEEVKKDTWVNIDERQDFVVHIPSVDMAQQMVASSATLAHGDSEVESSHLQLEQVEGWRLPRIVGPQVAILCRKYRIVEVGTAPQALILGEMQGIWLSPKVAHEHQGRLMVDFQVLNPLARLGGNQYVVPGSIVLHNRPQ